MHKKDYLLLANYLFCDRPLLMRNLYKDYLPSKDYLKNINCYFDGYKISKKLRQEAVTKFKDFNIDSYKEKLKALDINVLYLDSEEYPDLLRQIYDPPIVLFYKGDIGLLKKDMFAVVGAREISDYGRLVTKKLVSELCGYFVIVSGMARGIDTVAHKEVLGCGGKTVAVVGTGLDRVYPSENNDMYKEIVESGLVISEYPLGSEPLAYHFPQRNRIISGLSKGVLVCEAGDKSGAVITAKQALEQNRDVFAVPGSIFSKQSIGTNDLIQEGAKLVASVDDIIKEFNFLMKVNLKKVATNNPNYSFLDDKLVDKNGEIVDLSEEGYKILKGLSVGVTHLDDLVMDIEIELEKILAELMIFEMKGLVMQLPGQFFRREF